MESNICLILLVGIPGAGKTTLAAKISDIFKRKYNILPISYDRYLTDLVEYREIRYQLLLAIENLIQYLKDKSIDTKNNFLLKDLFIEENLPYIILIDDNMHYRSMRYRFYQISKRYNISFGQIYLKCPLDIALQQNLQRSSTAQISEDIITKMYDSIEFPNPTKHKWEKFSLQLEKINDIDEFISQVFENPLQNVELSIIDRNNLPSETFLHKIDIFLRKRVNVEIKNLVAKKLDTDTLRLKIDQVTQYKNMLHLNIKKGEIIVDPLNVEENVYDLFVKFC